MPISRLLLTAIVIAGAANTVSVVSATSDAIEHIGHAETAMAELTQYITGTHAVIRERVALGDAPVPQALNEFDATFDRRLAELRTLTAQVTEATAHVGSWSGGFMPEGSGANNLRAIDAERRAYVQAVALAGTEEPTQYQASGVRLVDLRAQKLLATITAQRDYTDVAKSGALMAAETTVMLSFPAAALLISYLIWRPTPESPLGS
jgi:hypothetical protein